MKKTLKIVCSFFLILPSILIAANQVQTDSPLLLKRIAQVVPSENGKKAAITVYKVENFKDGKKWEYSLYLKDENNKLNLLDKSDHISSVVWMNDDAHIAYISPGKKYQSLWVVDSRYTTKNKLFEFRNDIQLFKFSPNEKEIAFTADEETKKISYALLDEDTNFPHTRLFLVSAKPNSTAMPITPLNYTITQFFVYPGFDWSPDGQSLAFGYKYPASQFYSAENNKIGIYNLKTHLIKTIPYTEIHNSGQPLFSPDGKWIAFQARYSKDDII